MTDCETMERTARTPESAGRLAYLLGGAIGDALGYRVEFDRWPEIERQYGPFGIQLASAEGPLVVSDDTQMTHFTLEEMSRCTGGSRQ
jgi:ADP-ribosylglycohydrolase